MKYTWKTILSLLIAFALVIPAPVYAASGDTTVYITDTGKCYHSQGCSSLKKSCYPIALKDAVGKYSPCSKCNPPTLDAAAATQETVPAAQAADSSAANTVASSAGTSVSKSSTAVSKETKKKVQQALNDLGYDCGKADGAFGKKSKAALKKYQKSCGITQTGKIDDATLTALGIQ